MENQKLENTIAEVTKGVAPGLMEAIHQARDARDAVQSEHESGDHIEGIHAQLLINRANIERLEYLTSSLGLIKARTEQAVAQRKAEYDDAYMHAATKKSVGFSDYASAKEKDAHFSLGTVEQTIRLRKVESAHRDVVAAWDYCRSLLRGAEAVQRDVELRIRLISLRSNLER